VARIIFFLFVFDHFLNSYKDDAQIDGSHSEEEPLILVEKIPNKSCTSLKNANFIFYIVNIKAVFYKKDVI